ncbi:hypothetical protein F5Y07DRAFT_221822 [Xylaria sp. FL0933]|nr:hypothetical protein F5Y07DRAFT_221822 [Xylaria sp. FL0933]
MYNWEGTHFNFLSLIFTFLFSYGANGSGFILGITVGSRVAVTMRHQKIIDFLPLVILAYNTLAQQNRVEVLRCTTTMSKYKKHATPNPDRAMLSNDSFTIVGL